MRTDLALAAALLAAAPSASARRAAPPAGAELLTAALAAPTTGYQGRLRVESFAPDGRRRARTVLVAFLPPDRLRRETRGRGGRAAVSVSREAGASAREIESLLAAYEVLVSTGGRVAKRSCWVLLLRSRADGIARRRLWVAREGGFLLKSEIFGEEGALASRERFLSLDRPASPDPALFAAAPAATAAPAAPPPAPSGRRAVRLAPVALGWLPPGFAAVEARPTRARGARGLLQGFSDGARALTLQQYRAGAVSLDGGRSVRVGAGEGRLLATPRGRALAWTRGGRTFVLVGDLSEADLLRAARSAGP